MKNVLQRKQIGSSSHFSVDLLISIFPNFVFHKMYFMYQINQLSFYRNYVLICFISSKIKNMKRSFKHIAFLKHASSFLCSISIQTFLLPNFEVLVYSIFAFCAKQIYYEKQIISLFCFHA